jgi:HK97 family phage portal protein
MGWLSSIFSNSNISTADRATISRLFGSFRTNKMGTNSSQLLEEGFEQNVDVYSVITKTHEIFNSIPQLVERKTSEGWEVEEDTTIHELWERPNFEKGYTWSDINTQRIIYLLASGNSYMIGQEGFGPRFDEVDVLPSPSVTITTNQDFFMPNPNYNFKLGSNERNYTKEELQQIKLFNPSFSSVTEAQYGLSLIQVASRVVKTGNDRWDASATLFQNRGAIGFVTDSSDRPMQAEEAEAVQAAFDNRSAGADKFGRTLVTNKDLKFQQMAMSSTDMQLVEQGVVGLRAICNVLGYDSSLFNDPANKTFNNRKEAEKSMYTNVMMSLADIFDSSDTNFIAKNHYPDGSRRIRHDFNGIEALQSDKKTEAEKDKIEMEGINLVLSMPISNEAKKELLIEKYEINEDLASLITQEVLTNQDNAEGQ